MPKVHGTGSPNTRPAGEAAGAAAGRDLSSSITLLEIQQDWLTKIAAASWLKTAGVDASAWKFDPALVREIYETELWVPVGRKTVPLQRVMILEGRALSVVDKRNYLLSMINAFQRHDQLALNFDKSTPYTECLVGDTGRIHFIGGILEMESLVNFKIYQLCQAQMMSHDAAYQKSVSHANGPPASSSKNHAEDTDMPLTNGEIGNGSLENGATCESTMEE